MGVLPSAQLLSTNGTSTLPPEGKSFTFETLAKMIGQIRPVVCLVGIVARPHIARVLRQTVADVRPGNPYGEHLSLFSVPIYEDYHQEEPWIPFYDEVLLRRYLSRNEPSEKPAQ